MFVLTLDQRRSRESDDLVGPWLDELNTEFVAGLRLPFVRTAGDEMQGLFTDPYSLIEVIVRAHDAAEWWIGVGLGRAEPLGDTARDSRGPAFQHARTALEVAKTRSWRCAAAGDPDWVATAADGALATIIYVRASRSPHANGLVNRALAGSKQVDIARELRITPQAVSKQLKNAGLDQERRGREALAAVLSRAER